MAIPEDDLYQQEPHEEVKEPYPYEPASASGLNQWLLAITLVLIIAVAVSIGYTLHEQGAAQKLASANGKLAVELTQTQTQVAGLNAKLNALTTPKIQPAPPPDENWNGKAAASAAEGGRRIHRATRRPVMSAWQRKMQERLAEQQRALNSTQQAVAKTQADLASNAASTQSSLSGLGDTIAKNHAELVALEELGKRNYYEFDITKSKKFAREGPVSLALRHTSTKHQNYDLDLLVDDIKLSRKHVDLYQPVVFETSESPRPLELVVNRIGKNDVHGYVSVPKSYGERPSQTAVAATQPVPTAKNSPPQAAASPNTSQVASAAHQ